MKTKAVKSTVIDSTVIREMVLRKGKPVLGEHLSLDSEMETQVSLKKSYSTARPYRKQECVSV